MGDFLTKTKEQIILYWMMGFYLVLFSGAALTNAVLGSLIGADWATMDAQGHFMIILAVFGNWATVMMAFFNKAAARIFSGQLPIAPDDTQIISSAKTQTVQRTETLSLSQTSPQNQTAETPKITSSTTN